MAPNPHKTSLAAAALLLTAPLLAAPPPAGKAPGAWQAEPGATWAFYPPRRAAVPRGPDGRPQAGNPIDAFVLQRLRAAGLRPAPPADRVTLLRRATYDLHGLPPTPEETEDFLRDPRPTPVAFRDVTERLLASPRYGERWARRWLDVVRYADTGGGSNDFERPNAWRYRDYVVRSLNRDKPYDRFVIEQLAGDELDSADAECLIATGFLRMGPWEHTGMSVEAVTRQQWLDDVTAITGTTFLGLTTGCARCHDHKFDPLSAREYYRLQAVFAATRFAERPAPWLPEENRGHFERDAGRLRQRLDRLREPLEALQEKSRQAVARQHGVASADLLPRDVVMSAVRAQLGLDSADLERDRIYRKWIQLFEGSLPRYEPRAFSVETGPPAETFLLLAGQLAAPGERVSPGVPAVFRALGGLPEPELSAAHARPGGTRAPGRRLVLARWIASAAHPLTARVFVNRVWQGHFGRGLVETSSNFGKMGKRPTHPELLDFLAAGFTSGDYGSLASAGARPWSLKALQRVIMASEAYRRSGEHPEPARAEKLDPEGRLLSRFRPRRLEAEELRDGMLAVSGELSTGAGGPGSFPEINEELARQPRHVMGTIAPAWEPSPTRSERGRRTLYTFQQRSLQNPLVEAFNGASPNDTCERRLESTVTPQVFAQFNSRFAHDTALAFALRLEREAGSDAARVERAFRLCYQRSATAGERASVLRLLAQQERHHAARPPAPRQTEATRTRRAVVEQTGEVVEIGDDADTAGYERGPDPAGVPPRTRALADVCRVLLNAGEFIYVY